MATKRKIKSTQSRSKSTRTKTPSKAKKTKTPSKAKKTTKAKKTKAFGGYAIRFANRKETAEQIFGKKPLLPSEMTKKLWVFIKSEKLATS